MAFLAIELYSTRSLTISSTLLDRIVPASQALGDKEEKLHVNNNLVPRGKPRSWGRGKPGKFPGNMVDVNE